jgi:hypothetical protein
MWVGSTNLQTVLIDFNFKKQTKDCQTEIEQNSPPFHPKDG